MKEQGKAAEAHLREVARMAASGSGISNWTRFMKNTRIRILGTGNCRKLADLEITLLLAFAKFALRLAGAALLLLSKLIGPDSAGFDSS